MSIKDQFKEQQAIKQMFARQKAHRHKAYQALVRYHAKRREEKARTNQNQSQESLI